jgi:hypothetical protein
MEGWADNWPDAPSAAKAAKKMARNLPITSEMRVDGENPRKNMCCEDGGR